jgi:glycosyltransferase involved in cell wall biosynthesis
MQGPTNMPLRIAQVSATFPPYFGGTGNVCFHNARQLAARGHKVEVFTAAATSASSFEVMDGVGVHRIPSLFSYGNGHFLPGLVSKLRQFDIAHLHYPFYGGELSTLGALWGRIPMVMTYHQDVHLKGAMRFVEWPIRQTLGRLSFRYASRVMFTTRDYAGFSYARQFISDRDTTIEVLPNGVDLERFSPAESKRDVRDQLGLPLGAPIVLLVARLDRAHYFKGVDVLLRSLPSLDSSAVAVIVGEGELKPVYQSLANELGVGDRVLFTGRVTNDDLPRYYQAADVTVLPSTTMGEAFGLVLVESMACATAVIASNLPGVREVVSEGKNGLLVEPGDTNQLASNLNTLLEDPELRNAFGASGREKVIQTYDWRKIGIRLEQIYFDALHEAHSDAARLLVDNEWSRK